MIKMIIVEDEKLEREGLVDFFDWESLGIEIVGLAVDGIEGLELAKAVKPDIIITDIKMPGKDGLQMSKEIRSILPNAKILVLTGYDDFNYAREAIGFRANAYILKPVEEEEMLSSIKEVVEQCNQEYYVELRLTKEYYAAKNELLLDFLNNRIEKEMLLNRLNEFDIYFNREDKCSIFIIKALDAEKGKKIKDYIYDVKNVLKQEMYFELFDENSKSIIFCMQTYKSGDELLSQEIKDVIDFIGKDIGKVIYTFSETGNDVARIDEEYQAANSVLEYGMFWDMEGYIARSNVEISSGSNFNQGVGEFISKGNEYTKLLLKATGESEVEKVNDLIDEIFEFLTHYRNIDKKYIMNYLYNIVYETSLLAYNLNKNEDEVFSSKDNLGNHIYELESIQKMKSYIFSFFDKVMRVIDEKRNKKDEYIIKRVIKMIEEKYSGDLSLKVISQEVFLSPNYLGNIFKKYVGKSFNDYLSDYRMGKAKELLTTTNKKISAIASEVGVSNTSYFCIVFKNLNGMAPQEYREMIMLK